MSKNITIPIEEHTRLVVTEKWMESICRAFYENCRLSAYGEKPTLEMTLDGKEQIIHLIKYFKPDIFYAITEAKIQDRGVER